MTINQIGEAVKDMVQQNGRITSKPTREQHDGYCTKDYAQHNNTLPGLENI